MDVSQLRDAVSHITASDAYKDKTVQMLVQRAAHPDEVSETSGGGVRAEDLRERSRRRFSPRTLAYAASITAALTLIVMAGIFFLNRTPVSDTASKNGLTSSAVNLLMSQDETSEAAPESVSEAVSEEAVGMTAAAGTEAAQEMAVNDAGKTDAVTAMDAEDAATAETAAGCAPSYFSDMNYALLEVGDSTYYVKGDGRLFLLQASGTDKEIITLPIEPCSLVFSDGIYLYYSLANQIHQFAVEDSVDGTAEDAASQVILEEDRNITLDYIDLNQIIYHNAIPDNLRYNYTILDRESGKSRLLFENAVDLAPAGEAVTAMDGSSSVFLSLIDVSGDTAVFEVSGYSWSSLYTVNLHSLQATKIYDGPIVSAEVIDDTVYIIPDASTGESSYIQAPQLWSVRVDGGYLKQTDLSSISYDSITWIARSGEDLLLAVYDARKKETSVFLYQTASAETSLQQDGLGYIVNFFATGHYFSLYSQDTSGSGNDFTVFSPVVR